MWQRPVGQKNKKQKNNNSLWFHQTVSLFGNYTPVSRWVLWAGEASAPSQARLVSMTLGSAVGAGRSADYRSRNRVALV